MLTKCSDTFLVGRLVLDTHISTIRPGDTVIHDNKVLTVCRNNINHDEWHGTHIFGDSYMGGRKLVKKVLIERAQHPATN